jgi:3-oxoacyl-[acyl-carrier-protein] synthase II
LEYGVIPATLNHEQPDPDCPVSVVTVPRPIQRRFVLKVSFTQMGQCAALVLRKFDR